MFLGIFLSKMKWSFFLNSLGISLYRFVMSNVTMSVSGSGKKIPQKIYIYTVMYASLHTHTHTHTHIEYILVYKKN